MGSPFVFQLLFYSLDCADTQPGRHNGISILRSCLLARRLDATPRAKTMDHDENNHVKHRVSECKWVVGHRSSIYYLLAEALVTPPHCLGSDP